MHAMGFKLKRGKLVACSSVKKFEDGHVDVSEPRAARAAAHAATGRCLSCLPERDSILQMAMVPSFK